jgi:uncharacterized protein (DUF4415 family)
VEGEPRWQTLGLAGGAVVLLVVQTVREEGEDEIVRIICGEGPHRGSVTDMGRIVRRNFPSKPTSAAQKRRLEKLAAMPDDRTDLSDIPELTETFWRNAVPNPFYRPIKKQLTLRLDADVIAWLRKQGKGYQTRANALLREAMLRDLRRKAS